MIQRACNAGDLSSIPGLGIFHHSRTEGLRWCGKRHSPPGQRPFNPSTPCPPIAWSLEEEGPARQGRGVACRHHLRDAEGDSRVKAQHGLSIFCWGRLRICSSVILAYTFLFVCYLFWFWYQSDTGLRYEFRSISSSAIFLNHLRKIAVNIFINVW